MSSDPLTVVTGATGQVGLHLIDALRREGRRVRALVLEGDAGLERRDVEVVHGDVKDPGSLAAAFAGARSVFHLAAVVSTSADPGPLLREVNVDGARNAARAAREAGVERFVHFSSIVVFDPEPRSLRLDETRRRLSGPGHAPYTQSKVHGEEAVRNEAARGLHAVVVHPTVIVGPHETHHAGIVRGLFEKQLDGALPALVRGGFDCVDVEDVVRGALLAEARGRRGESYLLGGGHYEVRELVRLVEAASGIKGPRAELPLSVAGASLPLVELGARLFGREAPYNREDLVQLAMNPFISHDKASRELGYRPRPIEHAIRRVVDWLRDPARAEA